MRRARLLYVLASAPAAVLLTVAPALSPPAVGAASLPPPYVVCIDPGHGGRDPGAIGLDGLVEKNLTLDVSDRLAALLRADGVTVVMTRTTDATVSIQQRSDIANASGASVFLPIYFNAWTTPTPDGSVVLYPYARDIPFASAISQAVSAYLNPYGDHDGGVVLRNDWWLEPTMPTATVESLFITNPHDAALLTQSSFRQGLAVALKNGVEAFLPGILQREQEVKASTPAKLRVQSGLLAPPPTAPPATGRPAAGPVAAHPGATAGGAPAALVVMGWLLLLAALLLAIRHRRRLARVAGSGLALATQGLRGTGLHRWTLRRRRRLVRARAGTDGKARAGPTYDELFPGSHGLWAGVEGSPVNEPVLPSLELPGRPVRTARRPSLDELPL
ncbi:MAG: N-acetylmuramoyl-L-alanine amidase [Candidatus Dormibacteria bacterium]|jgi:N-acetylmuramoyl-L-alanine amidase